jgi:hypothetical protein
MLRGAMPRIYEPERKTHRFTEPGYARYATAIGQLCLAWNDLHEKLGMLFLAAMGATNAPKLAKVWHSSNFDRPKRLMLSACIEEAS